MEIKKPATTLTLLAAMAAGAGADRLANPPHEVHAKIENVSLSDAKRAVVAFTVKVGAGEKGYAVSCSPGGSDLGIARDNRFDEICKLTTAYRDVLNGKLEALAGSLSR